MSAAASQFSTRLQAAWERTKQHSCDALLVTHLPNVAYLTGLRASAAAVVLGREGVSLITDSRYITTAQAVAKKQVEPPKVEVVQVRASYDEALSEVLSKLGPATVGFDPDHVTVRRWRWLVDSLHDREVTLTPVDGLVEAERLVKDDAEQARFRAAGALLATCVSVVKGLVHVGRTEREIAAEVERTLVSVGFEDRAFPTIVASGPNSALPHARPSTRRLIPEDLVLLDFGGVYDGYCVDVSRTFSAGKISAEAVRLHAAVLEAQESAMAVVRPGALATEVDAAARSSLARHGLADAFGHSTGHGLGLEIHEAPRIGRTGEPGADVVLRAGMVFTIEPGVYVPGVGGVRIEDDILVTDTGYEVLTEGPRGLSLRD